MSDKYWTIPPYPPKKSATSTKRGRAGLYPADPAGEEKILTSHGNYRTLGELSNGGGVVGPGSATPNAIARFGDASGTQLADSTVTVDGSGNISEAVTISGAGGTGKFTFNGTDISADVDLKSTGDIIADGIKLSEVSSTADAAIAGPASSTNKALVVFDGTSGTKAQDSVVKLDASGNLTEVNSISGPPGETTKLSFSSTKLSTAVEFESSVDVNANGVSLVNLNGELGDINERTLASQAERNDSIETWSTQTPDANTYYNSVIWAAKKGLFVAVGASGTGSYRAATSPDGVNWTYREVINTSLQDVAYAPEIDKFVAVADTGGIAYSSDAINWSAADTVPVTNTNRGIAWSPSLGKFVIVSENTGNTVLVSTDGANWTSHTSAGNKSWQSVCWAEALDLFVAVGASGTGDRVMTSPDGETWTLRSSAADNNWRDVCWSQELRLLVAVSNSGTGNRVMTSPDGINWTSRSTPADNPWKAVAWSADLNVFAAVSSSGTGNRVMTSEDGITWKTQNSAANNLWNGVCYSPELAIFCAVAGSGTNRAMTSKAVLPKSANTLIFEGEKIDRKIDSSKEITSSAIINSSDDITVGSISVKSLDSQIDTLTSEVDNLSETAIDKFTIANFLSPTNYSSCNTYDNSLEWTSVAWSRTAEIFVATGLDSGSLMTSEDGINWTQRSPSYNQQWQDVIWAGPSGSEKFVSVSPSSVNLGVMTSTDGINWTSQTTPDQFWRAIAWSPDLGLFCAVSTNSLAGNPPQVMTSPDGVTWTGQTQAGEYNWWSVCWSPELGLFCSVSTNGGSTSAMTSPDGVNWTLQNLASGSWQSVDWSPSLGLFCAVGNGNYATSSDGISWSTASLTGDLYFEVQWIKHFKAFVAAGQNGYVSYSFDGVNWTTYQYADEKTVRGFGYSEDLSVLVFPFKDNPKAIGPISPTSDNVVRKFGDDIILDFNFKQEDANSSFKVLDTNDNVDFEVKATGELIAKGVKSNGVYLGGIDTRTRAIYADAEKAVSNWFERDAAGDKDWESIIWVPELSLFVAVGDGGTDNRSMTSPDGNSWSFVTTPVDNNWRNVCWSPELGLIVAVAASGSGNRVMTSTTGTSWTSQTTPDGGWHSIAWSPELGRFAVVGYVNEYAMYSDDGTTWTLGSAASTDSWHSVCWSPELRIFCAVGTPAAVMTSEDGINWTGQTAAESNYWLSVCWAGDKGLFVAVSSDGTNRVMTSPDGVNWTARSAAAANQWREVIYAADLGLFVAVSYDGTDRVMTSPDGVNWTSRSVPFASGYQSICYSPDLSIFCAVNIEDKVVISDIAKVNSKTIVKQVSTTASSSGSASLDLENGRNKFFNHTLTEDTTFIFSNAQEGLFEFYIKLSQDGTGSRTVTWPASVIWPKGGAPSISVGANEYDIYKFISPDGGTNWYGSTVGQDYGGV